MKPHENNSAEEDDVHSMGNKTRTRNKNCSSLGILFLSN